MEADGANSADVFQLAIDAVPHGVLVVDEAGTIVLVNRELERQFGYARGELPGRSVDLLIPEVLQEARRLQRLALARASETGPTSARHELSGRRKDGSSIPIEIGLQATETEAGRFVLASVVDISERHGIETGRLRSFEDQVEFQRLVAELSSQLINLPPERIDDVMQDALGLVSEPLDLDTSAVLTLGAQGGLTNPVMWERAGHPPMPTPLVFTRERFPWTVASVLAGEIGVFSTLGEIPSEADRPGYRAANIKSAFIVPLSVDGQAAGAVIFAAIRHEQRWPADVVHRLTMLASVFAQVLARRRRDEELARALAEVRRLKNEMQAENVSLRQEASQRLAPSRIVGRSAALRRVLDQVEQVAATDSSVLLLGETGTGKELFATHIHLHGRRRNRPMVRVNCAAIPATLLESELFGREKGAYTGALARQVGRFELADGSTIFLDEIGDLPLDVQVKLLRVLEQRQIERLGNPRPVRVDTRLIAATHRDLERLVAEGRFREDLYYRVNVFPIRVPPLREHADDIPLLVWRFVEEFSKAFGKRVDSISSESLAALQQYPWPGNIRELRNVVERAIIGAPGPRLSIASPQVSAAAVKRSQRLIDVEREHIRSVLERTGWRIRGAGGAADQLDVKPTTLESRMARLGLTRSRH